MPCSVLASGCGQCRQQGCQWLQCNAAAVRYNALRVCVPGCSSLELLVVAAADRLSCLVWCLSVLVECCRQCVRSGWQGLWMIGACGAGETQSVCRYEGRGGALPGYWHAPAQSRIFGGVCRSCLAVWGDDMQLMTARCRHTYSFTHHLETTYGLCRALPCCAVLCCAGGGHP